MEGGSEVANEVEEEATPMEDEEENDTTISSDDFITGVIEGFYNRPWTRFSLVNNVFPCQVFQLQQF